MSRRENQKIKLYRMSEIFIQRTDSKHALTRQQITNILETEYGIPVDRKTFKTDIQALQDYLQMDIIITKRNKNTNYYHLDSKHFNLNELKLLVDAVNSSKFITERTSRSLIKKLESFASNYEVRQLDRQLIVSGKVKTMNESSIKNIDKIYDAIDRNVQLSFQYFSWNERKEPSLRKDGQPYICSPWALHLNDSNYYMIAYDSADNTIKHFRVDKMLKTKSLNERRDGKDLFKKQDIYSYSTRMFNMYDGTTYKIELEAENYMANVLIDRFGKDIAILKKDSQHFIAKVDVALSKSFIGWIIGLGSGIKITKPAAAVQMIKEEIIRLNNQYM